MIDKWTAFIKEQKLFNKGQRILLAVSGGVDSMVLWSLFRVIKQPVGVAHCNFKLRSADSDEDEKFVKSIAAENNTPFYSIAFDTLKEVESSGQSVQMTARKLRYEWFEKIKKSNQYDLIATAHHATDNAETILLNLSKGTGIRGAKGIMPKNNALIRPLLPFTKQEIESYAAENQIQYRTDESNASLKYERNYIRHKVLPALQQQKHDSIEKINSFAFTMQESYAIYQKGIQQILNKLIEHRYKAEFISLKGLRKHNFWKTLLYEWLSSKAFNPAQIEEAQNLLSSTSGKVIHNQEYQLIKDRDFLILAKKNELEESLHIIDQNKQTLRLSDHRFVFKKVPIENAKIKANASMAFLDFEQLEFPLKLRPWKQGDYFYPFGMKKKKKKVSDFFQDLKLNKLEKENTLLLFSGEKLVWVCGHRIDDRFKLKPKSKMVYKIQVQELMK